MRGVVRLLGRPLWPEPAAERSRRWQRFLMNGPFGAIVGTGFGALAATRWGFSSLELAVAGGVAGLVWMYLLGLLESWFRRRARDRGFASLLLVHIGADLVGGGLFGWLVSVAVGGDAGRYLVAGASLLLVYSLAASSLLWGDFLDGIVHTLMGHGGSPRRYDYAPHEELEHAGRLDEALTLYDTAARARPGDADPLLRAAFMLHRNHRYEEAVAWYRRAYDTPRLDARRASAYVRHIAGIARGNLGDPLRCRPDLERLVGQFSGDPEVRWAEELLQEMEGAPRNPER